MRKKFTDSLNPDRSNVVPGNDVESLPWPDRFNAEVTNDAQFCDLFLWLGETLEAAAGKEPAAKAMCSLIQQLWIDASGAPSPRFDHEVRALEAGNWRDVVSFPEFYESTLREDHLRTYNDFNNLYAYMIEGLVFLPRDAVVSLEQRRAHIAALIGRTGHLLTRLPAGWYPPRRGETWPLARLHASALARWKLDSEESLSSEEIALLGRVDERSVLNAMSSGSLPRHEDGMCAASDVHRWLLAARPRKFRRSRWLDLNDDMMTWEEDTPISGTILYLPVDADGEPFKPEYGRRTRSGAIGWRIGEKGREIVKHDFFEALDALKEMHPPRWRRPNEAGNWGIVRGEPQWKAYLRTEIKHRLAEVGR
ncbi:hypothetical protein [Roseomonas gilardii]|uniref:hypothetical protein n=1 Tax=Roseomonas gilardii TaxID=257708 RepID=UPI001C931139|nr:hypothetical protein [Roseomonas gilardii]